jgi:predicted polyphosphate/ATP-dependent NAD kinase
MHSKQLPFWKEKMAAGVEAGAEAGAEAMAEVQKELKETKAALGVKTSQLNEVNLLNSKLLYVNRIFKANTLNDAQKLRVVESLDKAECVKEAKLIYETIKDSFNIVGKTKKKKTIKEGFGMASKAAGTSTAPKKEVISESNNMVARFQKLANIQINE